ncbi:SDR family NAD(P)-dependent oxidoreductase [Sulfurimonas autotrophica]|uniref:Short-chain dehydrogenase/reductase SDR n=1 Tax=Sulfurimonas autotrophica (strain ATCC BAA-671 / DSM 16294 / JCM 11897 / OK10) TaxID=563040 RepID=E0UQZ7_SULAO|nr:SDR family NAD(P)-dependent oxidoreductase [Sulfurimonas autotrophica]ADN09953.1 short-chain dehydrogenase/reductase SDR [Sulfurimonas autotrophica DSM 16294]
MKILITGASSGLGAEFARQYASEDTELILLARREQNLKNLQNELTPKCKSITLIVVDVTDFHKLQEKIKSIGVVDLLILNAGISLGHTNNIPTIDEFQNLYNVNVLANHAILEVLLPQLQVQKSGTIVFISSLASLFSMPSSKVYSSSKRALNAYAEGIQYKYKPYGIKVITILPGFIKSELTDKNEFTMPFLLETKEGVARMKRAIDKGREFYAFPLRFYLIIKVLNLLPSFLRQRIVNSLH